MAQVIGGADLTARFNALREVLQNEIRSSQDLLSARIDAVDAERAILLAGLDAQHGGIEKEIAGLKELQDAQHTAMVTQATDRAGELATAVNLRAEALARQTTDLAAALQLQLDQRFAAQVANRAELQDQIDWRFRIVKEDIARAQDQLDRRFYAFQVQLDQRIAAEADARQTALETATAAIRAALASAETAVNKAEVATEKRFEGVNEFRKQLSDQTTTFPTRDEVGAQIEVVRVSAARNADLLKDIELRFTSRLDTMAGQDTGASSHLTETNTRVSQRLLLAGVLVSVVVIIAQIAIALIAHHA